MWLGTRAYRCCWFRSRGDGSRRRQRKASTFRASCPTGFTDGGTRWYKTPRFRYLTARSGVFRSSTASSRSGIFLAMAVGVSSGYLLPCIEPSSTASVSAHIIPIAIGLILMMYPPLAKVRYEELGSVFRKLAHPGSSLVQNWVVGRCSCLRWAVIFLPTNRSTWSASS